MALTKIQPGMLATASVLLENFSATGSASSSTYLRGDNTWAVVASGADVSTVTNQKLFTTSSVVFANLTITNTATITNLKFGNTSTTQVGYAANILGNGSGNGALVYQSSPNTTSFLGQGSAGWLLVSQGSGSAPAFTSTSSIRVKYSDLANNLQGNTNNYAIPYQKETPTIGVYTTEYIVTPSTGSTYLAWNGSTFVWNTINTNPFNQALFTTSSVVFASVTANTGTFTRIDFGLSTDPQG